jgi:PIN domain nuclease of toxin-antitoxin system
MKLLLDTHVHRLLIAQSFVEKFPLISGDIEFDAYGVDRRW